MEAKDRVDGEKRDLGVEMLAGPRERSVMCGGREVTVRTPTVGAMFKAARDLKPGMAVLAAVMPPVPEILEGEITREKVSRVAEALGNLLLALDEGVVNQAMAALASLSGLSTEQVMEAYPDEVPDLLMAVWEVGGLREIAGRFFPQIGEMTERLTNGSSD